MDFDSSDSEERILGRLELDFAIDEQRVNAGYCAKFGTLCVGTAVSVLLVADQLGDSSTLPLAATETYLKFSSVPFLGLGAVAFLGAAQKYGDYRHKLRQQRIADSIDEA